MTITRLKNKYHELWYDIYNKMIESLLNTMMQAEITEYKEGNKNCRIIAIAQNAAFIACLELDERLTKAI